MPTQTWISIVDKYGWPGFILIVVALFFWKAVWPLFVKWMVMTENRAAAAEQFLREQIKVAESISRECEARNIKVTDDFLTALSKIQATTERTVEELKRVANIIDRKPI
jgi:hypothetical protein